MNHTPIRTNFIYPEIKEAHYRFGAAILGVPLRPDGDWRGYLPPEELQNIRGIESSACFMEGQQHSIATVEAEVFGEMGNNYSARFNALLAGGTESGGDPLKGADSIRNDGLIPDAMMPFGDLILSWTDFHSWKGVDIAAAKLMGQEYLGKKKLTNEIVFERGESIEDKYAKARTALKYCPIPVSVTAWYEKDGIYYKPAGSNDNHLVELVYIDEENHPYIRDTYTPFLKKLEANYNFDFGMRWTVEKKTMNPGQQNQLISLYQQLVSALSKILAILRV